MKRLIAIFAVVIAAFLLAVPCFAQSSHYVVYDGADLFTDEEEATLGEYLAEVSGATTFYSSVAVITTDYTGGRSAQEYADDFFDRDMLGKGWSLDGVVYLIDMYNREIWISCSGAYMGIMSADRIDTTLDYTYYYVSSGAYFDSAAAFIASVDEYSRGSSLKLCVDEKDITLFMVTPSEIKGFSAGDASRYEATSEGTALLYEYEGGKYYYIQGGELVPVATDDAFFPVTEADKAAGFATGGAFGALAGLVISGIFRGSVKMSDRSRASQYCVVGDTGERVQLNLTRRSDRLVDRKVYKRYVPPPPPPSYGGGSSGGGGFSTRGSMHTSSGGITHTGGGRKF